MVMPAVDTGHPARSAICRAMLKPVAPSGLAQPMITSSTAAGSTPARSMAARTTWPPRVAPCVRLNEPRHDLVSAVRAVETMTASTTAFTSGRGATSGRGFRARRSRGPGWRGIFEAASRGRERHQQFRGLPRRRLGVRIGRELLHAPQDLPQPDLAGMEHRSAALQWEAVAGEIHHVDVRSAQGNALFQDL